MSIARDGVVEQLAPDLYLVRFLTDFPLGTPIRERVARAMERWPSIEVIDLLAATLAAFEERDADCIKLQETVETLSEEVGDLEIDSERYEEEIKKLEEVVAKSKEVKPEAKKAKR